MDTFDEALEFVKRHFGNKKQLSGPLFMWEHALQVAQYLTKCLKETKEINEDRIKILQYVALGHDLLEDTACTPEEIENRWGEEVLTYIQLLSNPRGDDDIDEYFETLRTVNEEVYMVKLSDIYANVKNSLVNFNGSSVDFLLNKWPKFLEDYKKLFERKVTSYEKTIRLMINEITPLIAECEEKIADLAKREKKTGRKELLNLKRVG